MVVLSLIVLHLFGQVVVSHAGCHDTRRSVNDHYLHYPPYKTIPNSNLGECFTKCKLNNSCKSINVNLFNGRCDFLQVTKRGFPHLFVAQSGWIHVLIREPVYGSSPESAVSSCKRILELEPRSRSMRHYWINPGKGNTRSPPFKVLCDMYTDKGGWTLVYSYRFDHYNNFNSYTNNVKPLPNWPGNPSDALVSTTLPLFEYRYGALNFSRWKEIGNEFLVKPTITNWYSCVPGNGDLVNWKSGSISCKVVRTIAAQCPDGLPTSIVTPGCGLGLKSGDKYFFLFEASKYCWPIHDPCGKNATNQLTGVSVPRGNMYIR